MLSWVGVQECENRNTISLKKIFWEINSSVHFEIKNTIVSYRLDDTVNFEAANTLWKYHNFWSSNITVEYFSGVRETENKVVTRTNIIVTFRVR